MSNILSVPRINRNKKHPNQKPLGVILPFIRNHTKPGDVVFDPFMGSRQTGIAALQTGRSFIGCEISQRYFNAAQRTCNSVEKFYAAQRKER